MRLMDSNEVCDLLGISKSTLYRWCGVADSSDDILGLGSITKSMPTLSKHLMAMQRSKSVSRQSSINNYINATTEETPNDFPRPFKIGRAYKWKDTEIMDWLETRRV